MNPRTVLGIALVACALLALPAGSSTKSNVTVIITDDPVGQFSPAYLVIPAGTTVTYVNQGMMTHDVEPKIDHPAGQDVAVGTAFTPSQPTSPPTWEADVDPGHSIDITYSVSGVYVINCNQGPTHAAMKEVVVVQ